MDIRIAEGIGRSLASACPLASLEFTADNKVRFVTAAAATTAQIAAAQSLADKFDPTVIPPPSLSAEATVLLSEINVLRSYLKLSPISPSSIANAIEALRLSP
jgi:hypothetical protein